MGFILPSATRLTILIGILIITLREICIYIMEMVWLFREGSCTGTTTTTTTTTLGGSDIEVSDIDSFQYPYLNMNFNGNILQTDIRAAFVPLIYEDSKECWKEINARCGRGAQGQEQQGSSMDCSVCLCEFERGQQLQITPNCCHVFHSECINKWLNQDQKTCPLCRTSLLAHARIPCMAVTS